MKIAGFLLVFSLIPLYSYCDEFDWNSEYTTIISGKLISQTDTITVDVGYYDFGVGRYESSIRFMFNGRAYNLDIVISDDKPTVDFKDNVLEITYKVFPVGYEEMQTYSVLYTWDSDTENLIEVK